MAAQEPTNLGELLKKWRSMRNLSQLDLAVRAETSARHLSFIETGRGRPSKGLLLRLADVLEIPLRARNALLESAGFASCYSETGLSEPEMEQVRKTLEFICRATEPYPVMIIDRYWNILMANEAMQRITEIFIDDKGMLDQAGINLMRLVLHPRGWRKHIENIVEFELYMASRVSRALNSDPQDKKMRALWDEICTYPDENETASAQSWNGLPQLLKPIHLKNDELELKLFTTIATLGAPQDITLQELRIECGFPVDEHSERCLQKLRSTHKKNKAGGGVEAKPLGISSVSGTRL